MLFSLQFQRNNRQNALAMDSAKEKTGEKRPYFHSVVEMKQPYAMTEPKNMFVCLKNFSPHERG